MRPALLAAALLLATAAHAATPEDRARAVLAPFKTSLKGALTEALKQGPENAIEVCSLSAPALAAAASHDGVKVGRTALKLRNPANTPPAWAVKPLAELAAEQPPKDGSHRVVPLPGEPGRTGYVETILVGEPCLACHGETLSPAVKSLISKKYPDDRATGFKVGELRGAFWVELPP